MSQLSLMPGSSQGKDIEGGDDEDGEKIGISRRTDNFLKHLYIVPYVFSVITFFVGAYMVFFGGKKDRTDIMRLISGHLCFVCGCMLMMNNDLLVTTMRMWIQLQFFKKNNADLAREVGMHGEQVKALQVVSTGLDKLNKEFGGDLDAGLLEIVKMEAIVQDKIRMVVSKLAEWYFDKNHDGKISDGPELDEGLEVIHDFFGNAPIDFKLRTQDLRKAMSASEAWKAKHAIDIRDFTLVLTAMLTANVSDNGVYRKVLWTLEGKGKGKGKGRDTDSRKGVGKGRSDDRTDVSKSGSVSQETAVKGEDGASLSHGPSNGGTSAKSKVSTVDPGDPLTTS